MKFTTLRCPLKRGSEGFSKYSTLMHCFGQKVRKSMSFACTPFMKMEIAPPSRPLIGPPEAPGYTNRGI